MSGANGLEYVPLRLYHTFANNGSVAVNGNINDPSNTAIPTLANRLTLLSDLTTVTDHLPVVVITPMSCRNRRRRSMESRSWRSSCFGGDDVL